MKIVLLAFLLVGVFMTPPPLPPPLPVSLCAADETIIFNCATKPAGKIVSLCASKDLTKDKGYLQYRFGLPSKVELEFPEKREQRGTSRTLGAGRASDVTKRQRSHINLPQPRQS